MGTRYKRRLPDPYINKASDQGTPQFGHLNNLADRVSSLEDNSILDTGAQTVAGVKNFTDGVKAASVKVTTEPGTAGAATVTAVTYGNGKDFTTVLTLTDFVIGALAGAGAALGLGSTVYTFPAGMHVEEVYSFSSLSLKCAGTAVSTRTGLGSVVASGAVSVLSGTATFQNRLTGQTITTGTTGGTAVSALTTATAGALTGIALNGTADVKAVFLNSAGTWNANNTGNLTASGTIVLKWTKMS